MAFGEVSCNVMENIDAFFQMKTYLLLRQDTELKNNSSSKGLPEVI